jgi:hypothetical protein
MKTTFRVAETILAIVLALLARFLFQPDVAYDLRLEISLTAEPLQCHRPLDIWLLIAALHLSCFAAAFAVGQRAENGSCLWFIEPHSGVANAAFTFTWAALLPLFAGWALLGMNWLSETLQNTPDCFSDKWPFTPTICAVSQILCVIGVLGYTVFVTNVWDAQRCREANAAAILAVQDNDLVNRWGYIKPAANMELCGGLSTQEISDLPRHALACDDGECAICLSALLEGDHARSLPGCGHVFHRACVDLWLLRKTACPLCKADVRLAQTERHARSSVQEQQASCLASAPLPGRAATS